jgi:Fe-S-cluster containining protein
MQILFNAMEGDYDSVATHYTFSCKGCQDNCCTQRFFHYTWAELFYLIEGLRQAEPERAKEIVRKSQEVVSAYEVEKDPMNPDPIMCPINFDGLCSLYTHRPMICRMHGLPHRVKGPQNRETRGTGCSVFISKDIKVDWTVNRTPHYTALARIERDTRLRKRLTGNLRMTTAEMIIWAVENDEDLKNLRGQPL